MAGFLFSMPIALTSYINSSYLGTFVDESYVGIIYIVAAALSIIAMLFMDKILTRFGNRQTSLLFSLLLAVSLLTLSFSGAPFLIIASFILYFLSINFVIASLDIFVEDFSEKATIGRFRGLYLTLVNSSWVIAQLISGSVINKSSLRGVYLLSAGFVLLVCVIFKLFLKNFKDPAYKKVPILKNIEYFAENKHISKIYLINLILKFFFAWMIIYTPIYLHEYLLFGWDQIGIIFTIMLLPFVILEFPLGKLSDKIGEKKMLIAGFLISAIFTLLIPLIVVPKLLFWALVLFATRIGAATIEVMSESYFFKSVPEEDAEETAFFRNTGPLSFILAPLVATPLLLFLPAFQYLFYVLGAVLLAGLWITLRLEDVR
ncbi:hypothetical protein A2933_01745 [Candidatus Nomurabacteria bacterium RIFCSPLOWO2_01_FULL_46_18]|uniref:Major facilitator superfamily (MFS) profile domain-containing protein n=1 Tax=Candidatus Nomurabacteria bacterium RIFCSPLOWO2_01_FULL_46_18 TaxID=1801783 RepID=A0A1F6XCQ2_9BACT|nr:MAG: hypothetical protein A2933_01745 [Candidatus Nomurabacteria bacterium RIFCSPLOWO2_01_FULL_46_18]